jgi:hypothetical protein
MRVARTWLSRPEPSGRDALRAPAVVSPRMGKDGCSVFRSMEDDSKAAFQKEASRVESK